MVVIKKRVRSASWCGEGVLVVRMENDVGAVEKEGVSCGVRGTGSEGGRGGMRRSSNSNSTLDRVPGGVGEGGWNKFVRGGWERIGFASQVVAGEARVWAKGGVSGYSEYLVVSNVPPISVKSALAFGEGGELGGTRGGS
jgi:hypothetical protein